jgi:integrase
MTNARVIAILAPVDVVATSRKLERRQVHTLVQACRVPARHDALPNASSNESKLITQGEHPKRIQEHLGHSSIQVTIDRYGHLFPDESERVADASNRPTSQQWRRSGRKSPVSV